MIKIKMIMVIITAIFTTNIASAQQDRPQGPPPVPNDEQIEEMVQELAKAISLNEEQEKKVSDLYFEHFEKVAEQQEKNKGTKEGRKAMQELNSDLEENIKALLTDDQKKLYEAYLEEQKEKRGRRGGPGGKRP